MRKTWAGRHPLMSAVLFGVVFLIFDLPQWLTSVWSIWSSEPLGQWLMNQNLHLGFSPWYLSAPFGIACLIVVCAVVFQKESDVEIEPFTVNIRSLQRTDFFRLIAGVQNSGTEKAYDTQIDAVFWRCSGKFAPFAVRKTKGNPISSKVREQVELDFSMHPLEPAFVVLAFAYRPRLDAKLRYQLPHFYYLWNGEQGELNHASAEERDKIVAR